VQHDSTPPGPPPNSRPTPPSPAAKQTVSAWSAGRERGARRHKISRRKILRWSLPLLVTALFGTALGVTVAATINMPQVDSVADFIPARITEFYTADQQPFASYARQRRIILAPEEIPPLLRDAVIAVEDSNFYGHGGFDAPSVARAVLSNYSTGERTEGASTLTMQLARKLFLNNEKRWSRKIKETFLAVELEKSFSKDQLLALYMNINFMGHRQYGMEAASNYFFGKSVSELTLAQTATLAGIPQDPNDLSPYKDPEAVIRRRNKVLRRMLDEEMIDQERYAEAIAEALEPIPHLAKNELGAYFSEEVRRYLEGTYGTEMLLERGLQVSTTLDSTIQRCAEKAVHDGLVRLDRAKGWRGAIGHVDDPPEEASLPSWNGTGAPSDERWFRGVVLESHRTNALIKIDDETYTLGAKGIQWTRKRQPRNLLKRGDVAWFHLAQATDEDEPTLYLDQVPKLQSALIVIESATGAVRGMVGGWDFGRNQFNRATQARRQAGSAFKLFVYGAALEAGFTPADTLFDGPVRFRGGSSEFGYKPRNYYPEYYGILTLRRALERSINVTAVKLMDLVGIDRVIDFARRAGLESPLPPYNSLALGSADLIPMELAAAYASIANQGTWVEPYLIESVRTPEGQVLEGHVAKTRTVTSPATAYVLTHMLEGVVDRGTARKARDLDLDLAGKTGTPNIYTDAWFVGFTPRYTILTWVGYDQKKSMGSGMGGDRVALPIWRDVVEQGLAEGWIEAKERFTVPSGVTLAQVEFYTGLLPGPGAETLIEEAFVAGTEPQRQYEPLMGKVMKLPWYQQRPFYLPKESERMPEDFEEFEKQLREEAAAASPP